MIEQTPPNRAIAELRDASERLSVELEAARCRAADAERRAAMADEEQRGTGAEETDVESEERYRHLVELSPDMIAVHSEGMFLFVNQAGAQLLGAAAPEELVGTPILDVVHPDYREIVRGRIEQAAVEGTAVPPVEEKLLRRDGSTVDVEIASTGITYQGRRAVLTHARDLTARKATEAKLRESEERLRMVNATAPVGIFEMDAAGYCLYANPRWGEITGRPPEEALGFGYEDTIHPEDREAVLAERAGNLVAAREASLEMRLLTPRGELRWVHARVAPMFSDTGAVRGWVGTLEDITERKQAEEALRSAHEGLRVYSRVVDESPDFISVVDRRYVYQMVNPTYCRWNAVSASQMIGHTPAEIIGEEVFRDVIRPNLDRCFAGESVQYEAWFDYRAAGRRYVDVRYYPLSVNHDVEYAVVVGRDITERKQGQEALERQQRLVDAIFDNILAGVAYLDRDLNFIRVNATYARDSGHTVEELIGRNHFDFFPNEENQRIFERVRDTGEEHVARAWAFEFADQPERGVTYWDWWLRPTRGSRGEVEGLVLSVMDVTPVERARRDVEHLNAELREASAAKDQFLAVLSHELRNPLAPILAAVPALRHRMPDDDRVRRTIDVVERNVKLQARLVDDLLDLSRIARGKMQFERAPLALDEVVGSAVEDQRDEVQRAGLALSVIAAPGLWVLGDSGRLQQALLNLLTNAIKFTPPGGRIRVACAAHGSRYARVTVEDTGIGIDRALLDRLFEMFRQGEVGGRRQPGLGIGLALVRSITEQHGGRVWAETGGPGKGSRFTIELPRIEAPANATPGKGAGGPPAHVSVLPGDGNPDTRALLADSLGLMGYQVQAAATAGRPWSSFSAASPT